MALPSTSTGSEKPECPRRCSVGARVQQNRVVLNHLFEDVPHHRILLLDQFLGLLDGGAMPAACSSRW